MTDNGYYVNKIPKCFLAKFWADKLDLNEVHEFIPAPINQQK